MTLSQIRLTSEEINAIKKSFQLCFGSDDHLWIFGSRINPKAKGGDIDLYIESSCQDVDIIHERKLHFLTTVKFGLDSSGNQHGEKIKGIGDRKIDVAINFGDDQLLIYKIAREEGIQLV